jgi:bifunctional non-homologous end joining protein LigD
MPTTQKNTSSPDQHKTESTTLYFCEGSSDKIYQAELMPSGQGWKVNFAYGRRGNALQTGTKTIEPVSYNSARSIYLKLLASKRAKGYTPGENGARFQDTPNEARNTGVTPQLLNSIETSELETFLQEDRYVCQEKFDGKRILIRREGDKVEGINRNGLVVALPQPLAKVITAIRVCPQFIIDGELLQDRYICFDLLEHNYDNVRPLAYSIRLDLLEYMSGEFSDQIELAETAKGAAKAPFFSSLKERGAEGCVFKDQFAPFSPGRPASGGTQRKFKFCETATFVVSAHNNQRSVSLALYNPDKRLIPAGNVTIPPNFPIPAVGALVEIRYLYAYRESGSIYQPVYQGPRDDIAPDQCATSQLKYKT